MKLPRSLGGKELVGLLASYGYTVTHQTGSHLRLTSTLRGAKHHITIPKHTPLRVGTLESILKDVASYLGIEKHRLIDRLFPRSLA